MPSSSVTSVTRLYISRCSFVGSERKWGACLSILKMYVQCEGWIIVSLVYFIHQSLWGCCEDPALLGKRLEEHAKGKYQIEAHGNVLTRVVGIECVEKF